MTTIRTFFDDTFDFVDENFAKNHPSGFPMSQTTKDEIIDHHMKVSRYLREQFVHDAEMEDLEFGNNYGPYVTDQLRFSTVAEHVLIYKKLDKFGYTMKARYREFDPDGNGKELIALEYDKNGSIILDKQGNPKQKQFAQEGNP